MRTGRFRFRQDWRGRQILEVEVRWLQQHTSLHELRWITASPSDAVNVLQALNNAMNVLQALNNAVGRK